MNNSTHVPGNPDLVLVRDAETGWAHVARQPPGTSRAIATGFLHIATIADMHSVMAALGYTEFARYKLDEALTTFWFGAEPAPPLAAEKAESVAASDAAAA